ncbi:MAG TPA: 2-oxo acid dehydrogenase subunit E2, partial [Gemmatimonadaceae bacterium]|nr:2-oxo acid dehydrogenase subunit E2 [Gemmatimonadaceae bacterium]
VVPTVFDADRKPVTEIAADTRALAERVREQTITPPELSGGTFTVSNLGMFGVTAFNAVVNPGQAAILAVGAAVPRLVLGHDGTQVQRSVMTLTLSSDHRILYGADAAAFLAALRERLQQPLLLLVD